MTLCAVPGAQNPHAFPADRPILTSAYGTWSAQEALPWLKRIGANHVWLSDGATPEDAQFFRDNGIIPVLLTLPAKRSGPTRSKNELVCLYLKTAWHEKADGLLVVDLLADYPSSSKVSYVIPYQIASKDQLVRVQERETGRTLSPDAYGLAPKQGKVFIKDGTAGYSYRAVFLAAQQVHKKGRKINTFSDGTIPSARDRHFAQIRALQEKFTSASVIRPTTIQYPNFKINDQGETKYYTWWTYHYGTHPDRLRRYEILYGARFDPLLVAARHFDEGCVSSRDYCNWVNLVRYDIHKYVKEHNDLVRRTGRRVRLFFGDQWKGIEPWLGDIDRAGYDEVVTSLDRGPRTVRFLTGFPARARRIARLPWVQPAESDLYPHTAKITAHWRWIKREMLFKCPDGITIGGLPSGIADTPIGGEYARTFCEFKELYDLTFGKQVFTHDINVYVVTAWGKTRSWISASPFLSQTLFKHMVDLPVNMKWISFDEVIAQGIPEDATVVMLSGEPDTAWGGGHYWENPGLVRSIRSFVDNGGGLLAIGGPTVHGETLAMADLFGVTYGGPSTSYADENLWNVNRWTDSGRSHLEYPGKAEQIFAHAEMPITRSALPADLASLWEPETIAFAFDSNIRETQATAIAANSEKTSGVFLNALGNGRCAYIGGYGNYPRALKLILYYVAGHIDDLRRLDCDSSAVATYFYPEGSLLIAFNHGPASVTAKLYFDPSLARLSSSIELAPVGGGESVHLSVEQSRQGFPITLDSGQTLYWEVKE